MGEKRKKSRTEREGEAETQGNETKPRDFWDEKPEERTGAEPIEKPREQRNEAEEQIKASMGRTGRRRRRQTQGRRTETERNKTRGNRETKNDKKERKRKGKQKVIVQPARLCHHHRLRPCRFLH
ncbi:hypothetical protein NC652_035024 [Populus alba x Populus x berolinensis]|nr:hypothetical protein NC652_035024 [Populus alba x Populus x berolinensis]